MNTDGHLWYFFQFSVILPNRYKCFINPQTLCDIFLPSGFPDSVTSGMKSSTLGVRY